MSSGTELSAYGSKSSATLGSEAPDANLADNDSMKRKYSEEVMQSSGSSVPYFFMAIVSLLMFIGGVFVGTMVPDGTGSVSDASDQCAASPILPNTATPVELFEAGMSQEEADALVKFRDSVGIMADILDMLDADADVQELMGDEVFWANPYGEDGDEPPSRRGYLRRLDSTTTDTPLTAIVDAVELAADASSRGISMLDGVDPASDTFSKFASATIASGAVGGCTSDQMCLNTASAKELKTLKYVGKATSEDFVAKRHGHCFTSIEELLNENGEMDDWEPDALKGSTKSAFKRALNTLIKNEEESKLCTACACALCGSSEKWDSDVSACVSLCPEGFIWKETTAECIDASEPEVTPPPVEPEDPDSSLVVKYDESPKEVRFSPTPKAAVRGVWQGIQDRLAAATSSIDVAMFSFSDVSHRKALMAAAERGVKVRVVMQTGTCSQCKYCKELIDGTKHLDNPITVRFVTPTMHNKFTVIDYDSLDDGAPTRKSVVATGSCNWSMSSATRYDEDWMAFEGDLAPITIRAYKQEFEWLWAYSRPCGTDPTDVSGTAISKNWISERIDFDGCFTSYNMEPVYSRGKWGFNYLKNGADVVGACNSKMIEAIDAATESIDIAHTYFRSEPIYDAVLRRHKEGIHVRVINDGKEFRNSNKFPIKLADEGADVQFKYYARGWDFSCAQQMHIKFILIDADKSADGGCIVITGSENLSEGSEKNTFENTIMSRTPWVCDAYANQFARLSNYGPNLNENRTSAVKRYNEEATCFFSPITLSGEEIKDLRTSIDCRLRIGEYEGKYEEGECTSWGDRRPVLCFQNWYDEPCPTVSYLTIASGDNPDLRISSFTVPVDSFKIGASLEGSSCTVINNGTVASQSVKMQFVAARTMDANDPTATQISWSNIPELEPGQTYTATPKFNFGSGHDLGPFYLICIADADNVLLELAKDNNKEGRIVAMNDEDLTRDAADLVWHTAGLVDPEPFIEIEVGETLTFYGVVENIGNRHTLNTTELNSKTGEPEQIMMNIYISTDMHWDSGPVKEGGDEQVGWVRVDTLAPGELMSEITKTVKINTPGTWYLLCVIDSSRVVVEQVELNNVYTHPTQIFVSELSGEEEDETVVTGPSVDLVLLDFNLEGDYGVSGVVPYGEKVRFSSTVKNQGKLAMSDAMESDGGSCKKEGGVDCTRMKYYFYKGPGADVDAVGKSADEIRTEYEMKYWYWEKISALGVNETEPHFQERSFTESSFEIGCWSLFALLDYDNLYVENNELNNNAAWVDFEINDDLGVGPDLTGSIAWANPERVPDGAWAEGTAPLGARVDASVELTLDDPSAFESAKIFKVRFYLSKTSTSSRCVGAGAAGSEEFLTESKVAIGDFVAGVASFSVSLRMPTNIEEGAYQILAKLDTDNVLVEAKESNNIVATPITIENVPDAENERAGMPNSMQVQENKNIEYCPSIIKLDAKLYEKPSIGFWNLLHLSARTKTERDRREWNIISCVAAHFDVLAVEELEDVAALKYLAQRACEVTTGDDCECEKEGDDPDAPSTCEWDWHISHIEAGRKGVCEFVGFVWNKRGGAANAAQFIEPMGYYNEGHNDTMKREPYGARFSMGNFDFSMVAVHQRHGGHVRYRQAEAKFSGDVFTQFQEKACGNEMDVFYGGDMNLDAHDIHWSLLHGEEYAGLKADWAVDPEQGTTLARTADRTITDNAFDQVFWSSASTTSDEIDEAGAFDFTSPEIMDIHGGTTMGANIYVTVSDHIPVFVIFNEDALTAVDDDSDVDCPGFTPWPTIDSMDPAAVRNREEDCPVDEE